MSNGASVAVAQRPARPLSGPRPWPVRAELLVRGDDAVPNAAAKAGYFRRYFADRALNEEWVTASLGAFAAPGQEGLALPDVAPALDSLPWVQRDRRIFFLGSWLDALVGVQARPEAMAAVDAFLAAHGPGTRGALPEDLRRKVLQSADELRRTLAVRARYAH